MTRDTVLPDGSNPMMPSGVAFRDGALYVGALSHILRFDDIESRLESPGIPVIVTSAFPDKRHHGWKFIAFGPDGKLYVPVGAPCNTCPEADDIMNINRINAGGSGLEVVARGVRNTVGFDWHPETGELWFTDNGIDGLGDDMPADELNRVSRTGEHFGFPYVHQGDTLDQRYGRGKRIGDYTAPAQKLLSHTAALGMRFYTGDMFPARYKNLIFIAEHGSWNSTEKHGYRIMTVREKDGLGVEYKPFATGWLYRSGKRVRSWGRPGDVLFMKDGSMLISDTDTNAIYRVKYK
jgi:glucose/arabinose dehydrogenase